MLNAKNEGSAQVHPDQGAEGCDITKDSIIPGPDGPWISRLPWQVLWKGRPRARDITGKGCTLWCSCTALRVTSFLHVPHVDEEPSYNTV